MIELNNNYFKDLLYYINILLISFSIIIFLTVTIGKRLYSKNSLLLSIGLSIKLLISSIFIWDYLNFTQYLKYDYKKDSIVFTFIINYIKSKLSYVIEEQYNLIEYLNTYHLYVIISFISILIYILFVVYNIYGLEYKDYMNSLSTNPSPMAQSLTQVRTKLIDMFFKGKKIIIVELLALVWIFSILFSILNSTLVQQYSNDSGKSKKVLIYSLLSLISLGYLLLNIRNRTKNIIINNNNNNNNKNNTPKYLDNSSTIIISKKIAINQMNNTFSQFLFYTTLYYSSIVLIYYTLTISTSYWTNSTVLSKQNHQQQLSIFHLLSNLIPIIEIIYSITFLINIINLLRFNNQIYNLDKKEINIKKDK